LNLFTLLVGVVDAAEVVADSSSSSMSSVHTVQTTPSRVVSSPSFTRWRGWWESTSSVQLTNPSFSPSRGCRRGHRVRQTGVHSSLPTSHDQGHTTCRPSAGERCVTPPTITIRMQRVVEALTTRTDRETIRVDTAVVVQHRSENTSSLDEQRIVRHVEASAIGIALGASTGMASFQASTSGSSAGVRSVH